MQEEAGVSSPARVATLGHTGSSVINELQLLLEKQGDSDWTVPEACSTPNLLEIYKFLVPDKDINSHAMEDRIPPTIPPPHPNFPSR